MAEQNVDALQDHQDIPTAQNHKKVNDAKTQEKSLLIYQNHLHMFPYGLPSIFSHYGHHRF